jgi:iron(III) transport system ATP-binding protein
MTAALSLTGVSRAYRGKAAVNAVSVTAEPGAILAVLGASGSGKSTLLRLIAGLEPVDAGQIDLNGTCVSRPGFTVPPERRRIGLVFQDYALFPHLKAGANVAFGLSGEPALQRSRNAAAWLERVGLGHKFGAFPHELSGGEQQRVALARALAPQPEAVLLDEPFSGLDPVLRGALRDLTRQTAQNAQGAFIFVTHDAEEALYMGDRIAVMAAGRIVQTDTPARLYTQPNCLAAMAALGPVNQHSGIARNGLLETPFGAIAAGPLADGQNAIAAVRMEGLGLSPGGPFAQVDRRPQGAQDLVFVRGADGQTIWRGLVSVGAPHAESWTVMPAANAAFVFPA